MYINALRLCVCIYSYLDLYSQLRFYIVAATLFRNMLTVYGGGGEAKQTTKKPQSINQNLTSHN